MQHNLVEEAILARKHAYAPYSSFAVGAAVLTRSGKVYHGCNIENASYSLTCCAERTAIFSALTNGERQIQAIAIAAEGEHVVSPCGACRQVMAEFFTKDVIIYLANTAGKIEKTTIDALLPYSFQLDHTDKQ